MTQEGTFAGSTNGANLFNNNYSRKADGTHYVIVETNNLPVSVTYAFDEPTVVDAYRIWTEIPINYQSRFPMRWKFEGASDGNNWTLLDSREDVSNYGNSNGHRTYSFANVTDLRLDVDSWMKLTTANGTAYVGRADTPAFVNLGGCTLSSTIANRGTLYLRNATLENGSFSVVSGGWFGTLGTVVATNNVTFRGNAANDIQGSFAADNYAYLSTAKGYSRGDGVIDIYGTFGMTARVFHGARLMDGETIDFTLKNEKMTIVPCRCRRSRSSTTARRATRRSVSRRVQ